MCTLCNNYAFDVICECEYVVVHGVVHAHIQFIFAMLWWYNNEQDHISNFHHSSIESKIDCGEIDCDNITNEAMHHAYILHLAIYDSIT